ncbi:MAG: TonB-dependent receptor [Thauera sp.]|uniref:TonB-dependent receptor plug domain-containing protein n=1 Tax=Thauera sp. TaxID=1905334 RepID=UPI00260C5D49|nr:TonB-dependent receptor plug domain-containing protein [Thauera sp.]MCP5226074.1 TonB-dependent receptor [Thauera sp.]
MKLKPRLLALALALTPLPALSTPPDPAGITPDADLFELSLEQLMDVVVTSVSKRSQPLSSTAAAVHVISAEDIRRSGAANLPEALRLAPGVHVARFSNNRWSVSIRGFGGRYANKLLVLQDGRSLYSPAYSGVFWEFNDIPLELVERIEVVRGPGASIWGANAVNGVINIITRNAASAQGTQLVATAGSELRGSLFASQGVTLSENTHLEFHAKSQYVEPSSTPEAGPARDFWRTRQAGFRLDANADGNRFRLQGNACATASRATTSCSAPRASTSLLGITTASASSPTCSRAGSATRATAPFTACRPTPKVPPRHPRRQSRAPQHLRHRIPAAATPWRAG